MPLRRSKVVEPSVAPTCPRWLADFAMADESNAGDASADAGPPLPSFAPEPEWLQQLISGALKQSVESVSSTPLKGGYIGAIFRITATLADKVHCNMP